jgi:hypothetical protein
VSSKSRSSTTRAVRGFFPSSALLHLRVDKLTRDRAALAAAFWSDEHFAKLLPVLVAQIPLTPDVSTADEAAPVLSALFASLAAATASPTFLKTLNHSLLLQTRSESPVIRSLALQTVAAVWARKGEDMLELVPQTVSGFVSEALDDVEEGVEQSARELLKVMESLVGPLSSYFGDA